MIKEFISPQCEDWGLGYHEPCTRILGVWLLDDLAEFLSEWEKRPGCRWTISYTNRRCTSFLFQLFGDQESLMIAMLTWDPKWGSPC